MNDTPARQTEHQHDRHASHGHSPAASSTDVLEGSLKDPVCGMKVSAQSPHVLQREGKSVYFCSAGCKAKFEADPASYAKAASEPDASSVPEIEPTAQADAAGTIYTCPMHPEVRQDHPGNCPKCGMTLEPEMPTLGEGEDPELNDFKRRFIWTLPLTVVVTVLAMAGHRLQWFEIGTQSWIELVLSVPIVLWAGCASPEDRCLVVTGGAG